MWDSTDRGVGNSAREFGVSMLAAKTNFGFFKTYKPTLVFNLSFFHRDETVGSSLMYIEGVYLRCGD